jgi:hypothetical protein
MHVRMIMPELMMTNTADDFIAMQWRSWANLPPERSYSAVFW